MLNLIIAHLLFCIGLKEAQTMSVVLPSFEKLSVRVCRVLGLNPGKFTLQGTNTYLVGTGNRYAWQAVAQLAIIIGARRLLLDAGESNNREYTTLLAETLSGMQVRISQIVITHWHHDHLGGLPDVLREVCQGACTYST